MGKMWLPLDTQNAERPSASGSEAPRLPTQWGVGELHPLKLKAFTGGSAPGRPLPHYRLALRARSGVQLNHVQF